MAKFNDGGRKGNVPVKAGAPVGQFEIVNGKCKVCQSPHRREIDNALAMGMSQAAVRNHFNIAYGHDFFTPKNISIHSNNHMTMRDHANAAIYEERARQHGIDVENVAGFIRTRRANLERVINDGMDLLASGAVVPEIKDILAATQILEKMDEANRDLALGQIEKEFRAFFDAVKELCPEEMWDAIFTEYQHKLGVVKQIEPGTIDGEAEEITEEEDE